jgi:hypothetical protein
MSFAAAHIRAGMESPSRPESEPGWDAAEFASAKPPIGHSGVTGTRTLGQVTWLIANDNDPIFEEDGDRVAPHNHEHERWTRGKKGKTSRYEARGWITNCPPDHETGGMPKPQSVDRVGG